MQTQPLLFVMGRDAWRSELFSVPFDRDLFSETQNFAQLGMPVEHLYP
jgi:hypothetical protein